MIPFQWAEFPIPNIRTTIIIPLPLLSLHRQPSFPSSPLFFLRFLPVHHLSPLLHLHPNASRPTLRHPISAPGSDVTTNGGKWPCPNLYTLFPRRSSACLFTGLPPMCQQWLPKKTWKGQKKKEKHQRVNLQRKIGNQSCIFVQWKKVIIALFFITSTAFFLLTAKFIIASLPWDRDGKVVFCYLLSIVFYALMFFFLILMFFCFLLFFNCEVYNCFVSLRSRLWDCVFYLLSIYVFSYGLVWLFFNCKVIIASFP